MLAAGIDYAYGRPDYGELAKQRIGFVMRYISHDPGKDLDAEELAELWKRGIAVGLIFESSAERALDGETAGAADAQLARDRCRALGLTVPIYFAVDFDADASQLLEVGYYFDGAARVLGGARVGCYGGYRTIQYIAVREHANVQWLWQTYAWSDGKVHPAAHILQWRNGQTVAGVACDLDKGLKPEIGVQLPRRMPAAELRAQSGYWVWVQWRLGEDQWAGWGPTNPSVRPNVPHLIAAAWWARLRLFLARRTR